MTDPNDDINDVIKDETAEKNATNNLRDLHFSTS